MRVHLILFCTIALHFPTTLVLLFISVKIWVSGTVILCLLYQVLVVVGMGLEAWGSVVVVVKEAGELAC